MSDKNFKLITACSARAFLLISAALLISQPARALVNGSNTSSFAAVGAIGSASGVLIADNWVLTAGHVARGLMPNTISFDSLSGSSVIDAIYTYSSDAFPGNDIALVHLSTALEQAVPVLNDQVVRSSQVRGLGTLTIASAQNQTPNGYGTTQASSVQSTTRDNGTLYTVNWLIADGPTNVEGGDSGGALFKGSVTDSGGALLLGIASASLENTDGTKSSAFVQVASYKSWINSTMLSSGQQATWGSAAAVPEPATSTLFALSGLAALAYRAKKRHGATASS